MIKLGALWKGKEGSKAVLSGSVNSDTRIVILKNEYKQEEKHPDYLIFLAENQKKDQPQGNIVESGTEVPNAPENNPFSDDDIPF